MPFDANKPEDDQFISAGPADIRGNLVGLRDDQIVNAGSLRGYIPGNATGQIPISNGTVCTNLNAQLLQGNEPSAFATAGHGHSDATGSASGFLSPTLYNKLVGIETGAQVNQNAFANIAVSGQTTVQADAASDTLTLASGSNISITTNATTDTVTIACTYAHPTGDGNLHVPATGTTNNGKVLKAGATAGSMSWQNLAASEISFTATGNVASTNVQAAIAELDTEKVPASDVVTTAAANKILKLDSNAKLPASITGDAATVGGKAPGSGANNVLVLDGNAKVPVACLPIATDSVVGGVKISTGLGVDAAGALSLKIASASQLGGVKQGTGTVIDANGVISVDASALPTTLTYSPHFYNFGDSSDGAFNSTGNSTLAAGQYNYSSFTLNAGHTLTLSYPGAIIRVNGTCTIAGTIDGAGKGAPGATAPVYPGDGTANGNPGNPGRYGGGAGKGADQGPAGYEAKGGAGGGVYTHDGHLIAAAAQTPVAAWQKIGLAAAEWGIPYGAGGGSGYVGSTNSYGHGGAGGGGLIIVAKTISFSGSINCSGANGVSGLTYNGGGGGGGGGVVIMAARTWQQNTGAIVVNGGSGGSGWNGKNGSAGGAGWSYRLTV